MYTQATTLLLKQIEFNSNQHSIATVCFLVFCFFFTEMKLNPTNTSAQYVFTIRFISPRQYIFIIGNIFLLKGNLQKPGFF